MSVDTDPRAVEVMAEIEAALGFVPNFFRAMAQSPAATRLYLAGLDIMQHSSLSEKESQAVQLAISAYNECHYCGPAHAKAAEMAGITPDDIMALRAGDELGDPDLIDIVGATRVILDKRGWLDEEDLRDLAQSGIYRETIFDIIAFISLKTISNYINHVEGTPLDARFQNEPL
ncbi:MAG TPA: carboxymuconolactone decarboxylase family protein [Armatimonadota bacterium]|nr:carboxymuconolactone decarboxylase family protein [Armatimonadota bacterium]